jgi:hypothetical protein
MISSQHEQFLDLIVEYYNKRENWLENNTLQNGIAYRKVLKEIAKHAKVMQDLVRDIQWERKQEFKRIYEEKGYVPRKGKPRIK